MAFVSQLENSPAEVVQKAMPLLLALLATATEHYAVLRSIAGLAGPLARMSPVPMLFCEDRENPGFQYVCSRLIGSRLKFGNIRKE